MQDQFVLHMCLRRFQAILLVILHCDNSAETRRQEIELRTVIKFLFFPQRCYHSALSNYYSHSSLADESSCNNLCPFCRNEFNYFGAQVFKDHLIDTLDTLFMKQFVTVGMVNSALRKNRKKIYGTTTATRVSIYTCTIMALWAVKIISIELASDKAGTTNTKSLSGTKLYVNWYVLLSPSTDELRINKNNVTAWKLFDNVLL